MEEAGIGEHIEAAAEIADEPQERSCTKNDYYFTLSLSSALISGVVFAVCISYLAAKSHEILCAILLVCSIFTFAGSIYKSVQYAGKGRNPRAVRPVDEATRLEQGVRTGVRMTVRRLQSGQAHKSVSMESQSAQLPVEAGSSSLQPSDSSTLSERTSCEVGSLEEAAGSESSHSIKQSHPQASEESTTTSVVSEVVSSTPRVASDKVGHEKALQTGEEAVEKQSGSGDTLPKEIVEQEDLIRHRNVPLEPTSEQRISSSEEKVEEA